MESVIYRHVTDHSQGCSGENFTTHVLRWWNNNKSSFPGWAEAATFVFAYQVSSAASERVFSLLANMFTFKQVKSLGDYIQGSVMLAANQRKVG